LDKALQSELGNAPNIITGRARPFHDIKVWDGNFNFFYFKKSCSTDTFLSLLGLYDHQLEDYVI
jgi:hypothetical protein